MPDVPDAYEVGLPNQGVMILHEVLNEQPHTLAERTYSVWPDLAGKMRAAGIPQFTVDGHRPVRAFDVLGISFVRTAVRTVKDAVASSHGSGGSGTSPSRLQRP